MELKELVPDIELCKLIPQGEFEDTALVWLFVDGEHFVAPRGAAQDNISLPAPTLKEIMKELPALQEVFRHEFDDGETLWTTDWGNYSKTATETALRSWFYQKGIDVQKTENFEQ